MLCRLIDNVGMISIDGFYEYLTSWCNQVRHWVGFMPSLADKQQTRARLQDNTMYYVKQASFFPKPPV